jgi:hypothetical protein
MSEISRVNHLVKSGRETRSRCRGPSGRRHSVPAGCCIQHCRDNAHAVHLSRKRVDSSATRPGLEACRAPLVRRWAVSPRPAPRRTPPPAWWSNWPAAGPTRRGRTNPHPDPAGRPTRRLRRPAHRTPRRKSTNSGRRTRGAATPEGLRRIDPPGPEPQRQVVCARARPASSHCPVMRAGRSLTSQDGIRGRAWGSFAERMRSIGDRGPVSGGDTRGRVPMAPGMSVSMGLVAERQRENRPRAMKRAGPSSARWPPSRRPPGVPLLML